MISFDLEDRFYLVEKESNTTFHALLEKNIILSPQDQIFLSRRFFVEYSHLNYVHILGQLI